MALRFRVKVENGSVYTFVDYQCYRIVIKIFNLNVSDILNPKNSDAKRVNDINYLLTTSNFKSYQPDID